MELSPALGLPVRDSDGARIGRLADLTVIVGAEQPRVRRLLVRASRSTGYLVAWDQVDRFGPHGLTLRPGVDLLGTRLSRPGLDAHELLLARDVMDTQVVDLRGRRLARVSEVLLQEDGADLVVIAVDLGMAALLRRIGPRLLARAGPVVAVAWRDLHLTSRRGHLVQLSTAAPSFQRLEARDLAELLTRLSTGKATDLIVAVSPARAAAALHHSHPHTARRLVEALGAEGRQRVAAGAAEEHAHTIAALAEQRSPFRRRRFRRTAGWRVRRPPGPDR